VLELNVEDAQVGWGEYLAAHRRSMQRARARCTLFAQGRTCAQSDEELRAEAMDQEIMRRFVLSRITLR
jgi:hypothetical protein